MSWLEAAFEAVDNIPLSTVDAFMAVLAVIISLGMVTICGVVIVAFYMTNLDDKDKWGDRE